MTKTIIVFIFVISLLLVSCNGKSTEELDPEMVLTQAMQTAQARMGMTPSPQPSETSATTITTTPTTSLTVQTSSTSTSLPSPTTGAQSSCDIAGFVADVTIPDGTEIAPGAAFEKIWELRNDGTCTWTTAYQVVFYSGAQMGGPPSQQLTTVDIAPGETVQIAITFIAPLEAGRHIGNWVLRNAAGATFGIGGASPFYVDINVTGEAITGSETPTPTNTIPAGDPTATSTQEQPPTDTPVPTDTSAPPPTDTPVPSNTPYP